ncbi:hypothetical protein ACLK1Z_24905 [Escherichia coli]
MGQLNPPALSGSDILKVVYGATFRFDKEALINELDAMTARVRQQWEEGQPTGPAPTYFNHRLPNWRRSRESGARD